MMKALRSFQTSGHGPLPAAHSNIPQDQNLHKATTTIHVQYKYFDNYTSTLVAQFILSWKTKQTI